MKLAVVSHTLVASAPGRRWLTFNRVGEVVNRLATLGWRTTLIARETRGAVDFATYGIDPHVDVVSVPAQWGRIVQLHRWLRAARALSRADVALVFMPSLLSAIVTVALGKRAVVYAGGSWAQGVSFPRWRVRLESLAARRSSAVLVSGHALAELFSGTASDVRVCVPLVPDEVNRRLRTRTIDYPSPAPLRLLFVGTLSPFKGVHELLEALRTRPHIRCHVIGNVVDSGTEAEVKAAAEAYPNVTHSPYVEWPALAEAYRGANAFVLPSYTEGFPRVLFEAAAFGLALVVTPVGGIPRRLADGRDALFVRPADARSLGEALDRLVAEPSEVTRLARGAAASLAPAFVDADATVQFDRLLRSRAAERAEAARRRGREAHAL